MLSEKEVRELDKLIKNYGSYVPDNAIFDNSATAKMVVKLAKKLKEINNEASKYSEELYKANKELADLREHYEG